MSEGQQRLRDAFARQGPSDDDRQAWEDQERAEAVAFFEQTLVPGFDAAANAINQQAAATTSKDDSPPYAEAQRGPGSPNWMWMTLTVRRGLRAEFWFRGSVQMRAWPIAWTYRRNPRVDNDGTQNYEGTDRELDWNVAVAEWTTEQVTDDLLTRYAEVLEERAWRSRW
jgi:hypothetical protein